MTWVAGGQLTDCDRIFLACRSSGMKPEDANLRQQVLMGFLGERMSRLTVDSIVSAWLKDAYRDAFNHFTEATCQVLVIGELTRLLGDTWGVIPVVEHTSSPPGGPRFHEEDVPFTLREEPDARDWRFVMSTRFLKAIRDIDRKLQGRILEALGDLARGPMATKGDTVKPLSHDYSGMWRYRIGDYRLVYQPVPPNREILLIEFAARGSVY